MHGYRPRRDEHRQRTGTNSACYYLLQTASGTIYKINFGGTVGSQTTASGAAHTSDTYLYLGTQFAGVQICTDNGVSYLPCNTGSGTHSNTAAGALNCGTTPAGCTEEPLSQFIGVLSTGNKVTYTNGLNNTATSPTTGTASHNITATQ